VSAYRYKGRISFREVEPCVSGDVIQLEDHPDAEEFNVPTLDAELQMWLGGYFSCAGPLSSRFRITVESLNDSG
jgi:hypothetical protein